MADSFIVAVSGTSSKLECVFSPPIQLDPNKRYYISFIDLWTFNSIPNIYTGYNSIKFKSSSKEETITIPTGSYELEDLGEIISSLCREKGISFELKPNENTLKTSIKSNWDIDFTAENSIHRLFGFTPSILQANTLHTSPKIVQIVQFNTIKVICNIANGSYFNGKQSHEIYQFFPSVDITYKIIESQTELLYIPIQVSNSIDRILFSIVDETGRLLDFREEPISIRCHIKSI